MEEGAVFDFVVVAVFEVIDRVPTFQLSGNCLAHFQLSLYGALAAVIIAKCLGYLKIFRGLYEFLHTVAKVRLTARKGHH